MQWSKRSCTAAQEEKSILLYFVVVAICQITEFWWICDNWGCVCIVLRASCEGWDRRPPSSSSLLDSGVYVCNLSSPFPSDQYYLISDTVTFVATALVCLHDVSLMYACCEKCSWSWGRSALTMHMVQVMFSPVSVRYEVVLAGRNRSWEVHVHRSPSSKETRRGWPFVSSLTRRTEENAYTIYQTLSTMALSSAEYYPHQHITIITNPSEPCNLTIRG
jgi:hypothetical protein